VFGSSFRVVFSVTALLGGCAVEPESVIEFERVAADGSRTTAKVDRSWQGGPVSVRLEWDPETGKIVATWSSDVDIEAAAAADKARGEAVSGIVGDVVGAAVRAALGRSPVAVREDSPAASETEGGSP
jgi:hypothetical protein